MASVKALQLQIEPVPEDPQDPQIQNVFERISKLNASQILEKSADLTCTKELKVSAAYS